MIPYGKSAVGLAESENISKEEAQEMLNVHKTTFPKLHAYLDRNAAIASANLQLSTGNKFGRKRFFRKPTEHSEKMAIEREAKNFPIQGTGGDILKLSFIYMKREIKNNPLFQNNKVLLTLPFHDETLTQSVDEVAELWAEKVSFHMEKACEFILGNNLIKAEPEISNLWNSH